VHNIDLARLSIAALISSFVRRLEATSLGAARRLCRSSGAM
jgi:hypothetical protein